MKKKGLISLFILVTLAALLYNAIEFPTISGKAVALVDSYVQDNGNISLFFCPKDDCEGNLVRFIGSAKEFVHCALYDINLPSIQTVLLEKSKVIEVQVVTDDANLKKFNYPFVKADKGGLMHNKFCIVDGIKVSTGSMNPTENDAHKNNNNLFLINSLSLSQNYEDEFKELWNGTFKKGSAVKNPAIKIGGVFMENYFCPEDYCAEHVKDELKKAKKSIYFMTFSFTHEGITNILLLKHLDNITIQGVTETRMVSDDSNYELLKYQNISILKDGNKNTMHHKVFIIDNETVITGSFNQTKGGDKKNDENVLIIHDSSIAQRFNIEFESVLAEAQLKSEDSLIENDKITEEKD